MANDEGMVGQQSRLNEHLLAMKSVVEQAAERLSEQEWVAFADISEKAIMKQRSPQQ